jgi:hypothetical protein
MRFIVQLLFVQQIPDRRVNTGAAAHITVMY